MTGSHPITRRTALGVGGSAVGAAVLAACGGGSDDGSNAETSGGTGDSTSDSPSPKAGEPIAKVADVPVGGSTQAEVDGQMILLSQPKKGDIMAFSSVCTHQGCTVKPDGAELHCPCHNSIYDSATGEVKSGPAPKPLAKVAVKVQGDDVVAT